MSIWPQAEIFFQKDSYKKLGMDGRSGNMWMNATSKSDNTWVKSRVMTGGCEGAWPACPSFRHPPYRQHYRQTTPRAVECCQKIMTKTWGETLSRDVNMRDGVGWLIMELRRAEKEERKTRWTSQKQQPKNRRFCPKKTRCDDRGLESNKWGEGDKGRTNYMLLTSKAYYLCIWWRRSSKDWRHTQAGEQVATPEEWAILSDQSLVNRLRTIHRNKGRLATRTVWGGGDD